MGIVQESVDLRRATMADAEILFAWRNDPVTRTNSFRQEPVSWEDHLAYVQRTLNDEYAALYIAKVGHEAVGTGRAVLQEGIYTLSWTVSPTRRGQGWGKKLLTALVASLPPGAAFLAEVLEHNAASHRLAESVGLMLEKVVDGISFYKGVRS